MLAADTELDFRFFPAAEIHSDLDQLANTVHIYCLEGVVLDDSLFQIVGEELALGVIPGESQGRLGQVVGAKAEEVRVVGNMVGSESGARQLYNATHLYLIHI